MSIREIQNALAAFAGERDWEQFHTPRNLILAMQAEMGELAELVQWVPDAQLDDTWVTANRPRLSEEVSDVLLYLARLADVLGIDLEAEAMAKMARNHEKYPVEKARGNAKKYTEL